MKKERSVIMSATAPEHPQDGEVYTAPPGQWVGSSQVVVLYINKRPIGITTHLIPITNVSNHVELGRTTTLQTLNRGDLLTIEFLRYNYKTARFINYHGWVGDEAILDPDQQETFIHYVHDFVPIPSPPLGLLNLYEKICLSTKEPKEPKEGIDPHAK